MEITGVYFGWPQVILSTMFATVFVTNIVKNGQQKPVEYYSSGGSLFGLVAVIALLSWGGFFSAQ